MYYAASCVPWSGFAEKLPFSRYLELLEKDQADLLPTSRNCHTDPFKILLEPKMPIMTLHGSKYQVISLLRGLLELSGNRVGSRQYALKQEFATNDNVNLYSVFVSVVGTNLFGNFDRRKYHHAGYDRMEYANNRNPTQWLFEKTFNTIS